MTRNVAPMVPSTRRISPSESERKSGDSFRRRRHLVLFGVSLNSAAPVCATVSTSSARCKIHIARLAGRLRDQQAGVTGRAMQ